MGWRLCERVLDAGQQDRGPVGLRDVIVRAQAQRHDLVEFAGGRRQHDDGNRRGSTDIPADGKAIGLGKLQIRHDTGGVACEGLLGSILEPVTPAGFIALEREQPCQLFTQDGVIFHDENGIHREDDTR